MTLPASGEISASDVNLEIGKLGTAQLSLADWDVQYLANRILDNPDVPEAGDNYAYDELYGTSFDLVTAVDLQVGAYSTTFGEQGSALTLGHSLSGNGTGDCTTVTSNDGTQVSGYDIWGIEFLEDSLTGGGIGTIGDNPFFRILLVGDFIPAGTWTKVLLKANSGVGTEGLEWWLDESEFNPPVTAFGITVWELRTTDHWALQQIRDMFYVNSLGITKSVTAYFLT